MKKHLLFIAIPLLFACSDDDDNAVDNVPTSNGGTNNTATYPAIDSKFNGVIDLDNLDNYAAQSTPTYITKDNTTNNPITDKGATLGRVLFYDKNLSIDNSISCGSCHVQASAFGDTKLQSDGVNGGLTGRHSMRLINARFADEAKFFWDERANTLEEQTTMPIQDHAEMGYSGQNGNPDLNDLLVKLQAIDYYKEFFTFVYGDTLVTEARMQEALAQFVRSIQSFDSKFDVGRAQVADNTTNFPNFTAEENQGKQLFLAPPPQGGAGCQGCHRAPEFDIDPDSDNNNVIASIGSSTLDLTNTRAPSLRDLVTQNGTSNGQLMHDGSLTTLAEVVDHYNQITLNNQNTNLDNRLRGGGPGGPPGGGTGQNLNLTQAEKDALVAFLETLSGQNVYTDTKWSDPF